MLQRKEDNYCEEAACNSSRRILGLQAYWWCVVLLQLCMHIVWHARLLQEGQGLPDVLLTDIWEVIDACTCTKSRWLCCGLGLGPDPGTDASLETRLSMALCTAWPEKRSLQCSVPHTSGRGFQARKGHPWAHLRVS